MAYTVMLDAGHGGSNPGAVYEGRQEKDDTLALTLAVGEVLQEYDVNVLYTRTNDVDMSLPERVREANASGADYFVSIHRNSSPIPNSYTGIESLVYNNFGTAYTMAENINAQLEQVGFTNQGVNVRKDLYVLRRTQMPSVLVEAGFINTDDDNVFFDNNFDAIARAIANGIFETLYPGSFSSDV